MRPLLRFTTGVENVFLNVFIAAKFATILGLLMSFGCGPRHMKDSEIGISPEYIRVPGFTGGVTRNGTPYTMGTSDPRLLDDLQKIKREEIWNPSTGVKPPRQPRQPTNPSERQPDIPRQSPEATYNNPEANPYSGSFTISPDSGSSEDFYKKLEALTGLARRIKKARVEIEDGVQLKATIELADQSNGTASIFLNYNFEYPKLLAHPIVTPAQNKLPVEATGADQPTQQSGYQLRGGCYVRSSSDPTTSCNRVALRLVSLNGNDESALLIVALDLPTIVAAPGVDPSQQPSREPMPQTQAPTQTQTQAPTQTPNQAPTAAPTESKSSLPSDGTELPPKSAEAPTVTPPPGGGDFKSEESTPSQVQEIPVATTNPSSQENEQHKNWKTFVREVLGNPSRRYLASQVVSVAGGASLLYIDIVDNKTGRSLSVEIRLTATGGDFLPDDQDVSNESKDYFGDIKVKVVGNSERGELILEFYYEGEDTSQFDHVIVNLEGRSLPSGQQSLKPADSPLSPVDPTTTTKKPLQPNEQKPAAAAAPPESNASAPSFPSPSKVSKMFIPISAENPSSNTLAMLDRFTRDKTHPMVVDMISWWQGILRSTKPTWKDPNNKEYTYCYGGKFFKQRIKPSLENFFKTAQKTPFEDDPRVQSTQLSQVLERFFPNSSQSAIEGGKNPQLLLKNFSIKDLVWEIFRRSELPPPLGYISLIESARYHTEARTIERGSRHELGPWQFLPQTARTYRLKVADKKDERKEFEKATAAAGEFLKSLFAKFPEDYKLAIAGYNAGEGTVGNAANTANETLKRVSQKIPDFWVLSSYHLAGLPCVTQIYVPKLLALMAINEDPAAYGFSIPSETAPTATVPPKSRVSPSAASPRPATRL